MSGQFFNSNNDDGCVASTNSNEKRGLFAWNDATGQSIGATGGAGIFGLTLCLDAAGVFGANNGPKGVGVQGNGPDVGVSGYSAAGAGVRGQSDTAAGVYGTTAAPDNNAIFGMNISNAAVPTGLNRVAGSGVWGHTTAEGGSGVTGSVAPGLTAAAGVTGIGPIAGRFFGNVEVTGDVRLLGADIAEAFSLADGAYMTPGAVMVTDAQGRLSPCAIAYDKRAVGIVSGAASLKPAIILNSGQSVGAHAVTLALVGTAYCCVDADYAPVAAGDLLTTSSTVGHAMKCERANATGSIIGKALRNLERGQAMIPVIVMLR